MSQHRIDRLRIRPGPGAGAPERARRLARVAHDHLGRALDAALVDVGAAERSVCIERVVVRLPVDPGELDDGALAALWAGLIRDAVASSTLIGPATADKNEPSALDATDDGSEPPAVTAAAALMRWATVGTAPPRGVLDTLLSSPSAYAAAVALLPEPARSTVRRLLDEASAVRTAAERLAAPSPSATADGQPSSPEPVDRDPSDSLRRTVRDAGRGSPTPLHARTTKGVEHADQVTRTTAQAPRSVSDPSALPVSSYGGLVLLHHRLLPFLRAAESFEPGLDAVATRVAALALVADGGNSDAVRDDPLVRLLAGDRSWREPAPMAPVRASNEPDCSARADDLLRAFAGDLPGFVRSTPGFVREQWIRRTAVLVEENGDTLLRLGRRPLDLVLDRLPYPVGALRMPWTTTLFIGWDAP